LRESGNVVGSEYAGRSNRVDGNGTDRPSADIGEEHPPSFYELWRDMQGRGCNTTVSPKLSIGALRRFNDYAYKATREYPARRRPASGDYGVVFEESHHVTTTTEYRRMRGVSGLTIHLGLNGTFPNVHESVLCGDTNRETAVE